LTHTDLAYLRAAAACCSPNGRREESAIRPQAAQAQRHFP
jgi:hypothetical protein